MNEKELKRLIDAYLDGTADPMEKQIVENFFDSYRRFPEEWPNDIANDKELLKDRILELIEARMQTKATPEYITIRRNWIKRSIQIAAAVLLFIIGGYSIYTIGYKSKVEDIHEILPGTKKAILTLADKSQIILDTLQNGSIAKQEQISVIKLNEGQIAYSAEVTQKTNYTADIESKIQKNTLSIPRGGEYQITLADGTKVWLNSESTLTFPVSFTGKERRVEITGECYFEVAKNSNQPFIVSINKNMDIEVLGTEFNVTSYDEDELIKTTLIEGSVKITQNFSNLKPKSINLTPGQQASIDHNGEITTMNVDVREFTLWKDGWFYFNDQSLASILKKLSRWYDFSYTLDPEISEQRFSMKLKRFENFGTVEEILEKTGKVSFEKKANDIYIKSRITMNR